MLEMEPAEADTVVSVVDGTDVRLRCCCCDSKNTECCGGGTGGGAEVRSQGGVEI